MEDDEDGKEDSSDSSALKRRKCSSAFTILGGLKTRGRRSLSLKTTRAKKKELRNVIERKGQSGQRVQPAVLVEKYARFSEKDELEFCPVCQAPFIGLVGKSAQVHVQECLEGKEKEEEYTVMCPDGINCKFISPQHLKKFSHQQVANSCSAKDTKQHVSTNEEKVKIQRKCSSENEHKSRIKDHFLLSSEEKDSPKESVCNPSSNTSNFCLHEHENENMTMVKDTKDMVTTLEPEKKCSAFCERDECIDDISQWFNDDLKYEDLELVDIGKCSTSTPNSTTTSSSDACSSSQNIFPADISTCTTISSGTRKNKLCVDGLLTGNTKQTSFMKQMDIGVFFGLKPKLKAEKIGTEVGSPVTKVSQSRMQSYNKEGETGRNIPHKKCPFYKIIDGTSFAVDAFSYGNYIPGITAHFLSHFHYDHYCGLKKTFSNPIYCSQVTANLISLKIKVAARFIHPLPLRKTVKIQNVEVTLLDANHCPGAVMFIFKLPNGKTHLHTGDFRASTFMEENPMLCSSNIHTLYLDTTYCDPDYSFPPQSDTVNYCASLALKAVAKNPKTLIVVGTYTIGKEKIFTAVADALRCKVGVRRDKHNILQCLESKHQNEIITQNYKNAQVHVLPMADISHKKLALYLKEYSFLYCELLAIKPTGWTFTRCGSNLASIMPSNQGPVTIYGVPYSEHSSYEELQHFVKFIKPCKVIPTVNNGSATKRDEMNKVFKMWLVK